MYDRQIVRCGITIRCWAANASYRLHATCMYIAPRLHVQDQGSGLRTQEPNQDSGTAVLGTATDQDLRSRLPIRCAAEWYVSEAGPVSSATQSRNRKNPNR